MKKRIIIGIVIAGVLAGAFFFSENPPETVTSTIDVVSEVSVAENSMETVSEISVAENSMETVSEISVAESSMEMVSEISVAESSMEMVSEVSVAESAMETVSEISVAESLMEMVSEVSVAENSMETVSEVSVAENSMETVSEVSVAESSMETVSEISVAESSIEEISPNKTVCTISVSCHTLLNNLDRVKKSKLSVIPSDGWILRDTEMEINDNESVFDVTKRVCMENKIPFEFTLAPIYNTAYIEGINNIYEFDCGSTSGWLYKVNGEFLSYGCSDCKLKSGDIVEWVYTCNLGRDVGNEYKGE